MFIAKNDEEQRSRIWRAVVLVSTALITPDCNLPADEDVHFQSGRRKLEG